MGKRKFLQSGLRHSISVLQSVFCTAGSHALESAQAISTFAQKGVKAAVHSHQASVSLRYLLIFSSILISIALLKPSPARAATAFAASQTIGQSGGFNTRVGTMDAETLSSPSGIAYDSTAGGTFVSDTANNRVLFYPTGSSTPTRVYGQPDFQSNTANNGGISATSLSGPTGITTYQGLLYVADTGNNRVLEYPSSGSTTAFVVFGQGSTCTSFTTNAAPTKPSTTTLNAPSGVTVDINGFPYIADTGYNRVLKYGNDLAQCTATTVWGQGGSFTSKTASTSATGLSGPKGVAVDSICDLYIADTANNRALYYASAGGCASIPSATATTVYGQAGSFTTSTANNGGESATSLSGPTSIAVDSTPNVYIADTVNNRLLYYAGTSTTATRVYGQAGAYNTATANNGGLSATSLSTPKAIAVDSSANVYTADTANNRGLEYTGTSTTATTVWGQAGYFTSNGANINAATLNAAASVTSDSSGDLYVADWNDNRVLYFPAGSRIATRVYGQGGNFGTATANNGGLSATSLSSPGDVALDSNGNVYIADYGNNRVLEYNGTSTTASKVYGQGTSGTSFTTNTSGTTSSTIHGPAGITIDASNNLYISDSGNNRILFFPTGGVGQTPQTTATAVYGQAGSFTTSTVNNGGLSASSLDGPQVPYVDAGYNLYIADATNNRVLFYPNNGAGNAAKTTATKVWGQANSFTTSSAACSQSGLANPIKAYVDSSGNVYIADAVNNRMVYYQSGNTTSATRVYGQNGSYTTCTNNNGGSTSSAYTLYAPQDVTMDPNGNIYVADENNSRITEYQIAFSVSTQPPSAAPVSTTFTVAYGFIDVGSGSGVADLSGSVTVAIKAGTGTAGATLGGTTTLTTTSGIASFSLTINKVGSSYKLTGSTSGYPSVDTNAFNVGIAGFAATTAWGQSNLTTSGVNISSEGLSNSEGNFVDSSGNVYIADQSNSRVLYYPSGSSVATKVWGQGSAGNCFSCNIANNGGVSATSLNQPSGIFVDSSGNLYVADSSNNRVLYYPSGSFTATKVWGQGSGGNTFTTNSNTCSSTGLATPHGIYVDSSGNLYVSDGGSNRVLYFVSGSFTATKVWGQGSGGSTFTICTAGSVSATSLSNPQQIYVDASNNLYVADGGYNRVLYYASGSFTASKVWGQGSGGNTFTTSSTGCTSTSAHTPQGVYVDGSGNVYVADNTNNRVLYYASGSFTASKVWGQGSGGNTFTTCTAGAVSSTSLSLPSYIFVDSLNNIYVNDYAYSRDVYYASGSFTASKVWGQGGSFTTSTNDIPTANTLANPNAAVVDTSGNLYVADEGNNRVLYYPKGSTTATKVWGQGSSGTNFYSGAQNLGGVSATSMYGPTGVAVDSSGDLYVADYWNNRVLYFAAGSFTASRVYGQGGNFTLAQCDNASSPSASNLCGAEGVTLDGSGNVYIADNSNNRVLFYSGSSTTATRIYGQSGSYTSNTQNLGGLSANSLYGPTSIALDSGGNVYIADYGNNRVLYFSGTSTTATKVWGQNGSFTANAAGSDAGGLRNPDSVALDSSNNVYIADLNNNRVLYYPSGSTTVSRVYGQPDFTSTAANQGGNTSAITLDQPYSAVPDNSGGIYVTDATNNRVVEYQQGLVTTTQPPSSVAANAGFSVGFTAEDIGSGTILSDYTGNVSVAITTNPGSGTLSGTTTVAASSGVASFSGLSINNAGTGYVLTGSATTYASATTNAFNVTGGSAGTLTGINWSVDNNQTSHAGTRYEYNFTTATSGSISTVTMTVPSGTAGASLTVQESWGIGAGTASLTGTTVTYTVTSPRTIGGGEPIRLVISGFTNTGTGGAYTSTITTNSSGTPIDQGTSNSITFGASNTSTGLQADAESGTVTSVLTSANLILDPLTNKTATYTFNVTMTTDACTSWSLVFKDGGLKSGSYTINPVTTNGVTNASTWPTGSDLNVVGYQISSVSSTSGTATYQGALGSSNYAGFKTSSDTFLQGAPTSGATETVTFTVTVKVQASFATRAGLYSDTPQLTFTPTYC